MIMDIALKEWAVHIKALGNGRQTVILRKGGISEETKHFQVQSSRFFLYPTYEHQKKGLIQAECHWMLEETLAEWGEGMQKVPLIYAAEVVGERLIFDEQQLIDLSAFHIGTPLFATERLHWKKQQPLHALMLRVYRRSVPIEVQVKSEYAGCKSWLQLDELSELPSGSEAFDSHIWSPVYDDLQFANFFSRFMAFSH